MRFEEFHGAEFSELWVVWETWEDGSGVIDMTSELHDTTASTMARIKEICKIFH
jgi:hypothetical protein